MNLDNLKLIKILEKFHLITRKVLFLFTGKTIQRNTSPVNVSADFRWNLLLMLPLLGTDIVSVSIHKCYNLWVKHENIFYVFLLLVCFYYRYQSIEFSFFTCSIWIIILANCFSKASSKGDTMKETILTSQFQVNTRTSGFLRRFGTWQN